MSLSSLHEGQDERENSVARSSGAFRKQDDRAGFGSRFCKFRGENKFGRVFISRSDLYGDVV